MNIRTAFRTVVAVTALSAVALTTGCATTPDTEKAGKAAPKVTETPKPDYLGTEYGDAVCFEAVVEDAGEYCHVTATESLLTEASTYGSADQRAQLNAVGFTDEAIAKNHAAAAKFIIETVLDSPVLDTDGSGAAVWVDKNMENRMPGWTLETHPDDNWGKTVFTGSVPKLIRDGAPRLSNLKLTFLDTASYTTDLIGEPQIAHALWTTVDVEYRASDDEALAWSKELEPEMFKENADGSVPAEETHKFLFDGEGENVIPATVEYAIGYLLDGTITGYTYTYPSEIKVREAV